MWGPLFLPTFIQINPIHPLPYVHFMVLSDNSCLRDLRPLEELELLSARRYCLRLQRIGNGDGFLGAESIAGHGFEGPIG